MVEGEPESSVPEINRGDLVQQTKKGIAMLSDHEK
ncbi:hypothetical protein J2Z79_003509 [Symbiobacterium terraclitae]|uniref:Uncharacterized protein n=1 Tax=Symbiobacterium terraclitae TaxID=557451 RepID=A0ABS4JYK0_9FIRM|nr:hypothetical protein [Symbiobacterium terraclitae]